MALFFKDKQEVAALQPRHSCPQHLRLASLVVLPFFFSLPPSSGYQYDGMCGMYLASRQVSRRGARRFAVTVSVQTRRRLKETSSFAL